MGHTRNSSHQKLWSHPNLTSLDSRLYQPYNLITWSIPISEQPPRRLFFLHLPYQSLPFHAHYPGPGLLYCIPRHCITLLDGILQKLFLKISTNQRFQLLFPFSICDCALCCFSKSVRATTCLHTWSLKEGPFGAQVKPPGASLLGRSRKPNESEPWSLTWSHPGMETTSPQL